MKSISWRKGIFKCAYELFNNGKKIGILKEKQWSMSAIGNIRGRNVLFSMKNSWHNHTHIIDKESGEILGQIKYSCWYPKAKISLDNRVYRWSYKNFWSTKWKITDSEDQAISYSGHSCKGQAISGIDNDLVVLSGLFIGSYYWQMISIYFVCLLTPFWIFLL